MAQSKINAVLEKVISLTGERDSGALELALAQTLFTIADVKNLALHSAGNINRVKHAISNSEEIASDEGIELEIIDALSECLKTAKITNILHNKKRLTLFPIVCSKKQPLAIIIVEETANTHDHALTIQILKIYHNFVALMNDNERDTLTGLLNRKTFDHQINSIIANLQNKQARRKDENDDPTFLAIFDIDHFKRVNDTHGHLMGDEVLLLFSRLMDNSFRDNDLLFRFGGEEFLCIFQCPSDEIMSDVLNRFREAVADYNFPQVGKVTVSCGFTEVDAFDLSSSIIDRADVSLYHAKNNGRNQVCLHEQLVASGILSENDNSGGEIELF